MIMMYNGLQWIIDDQGLSWNIMDYHRILWIMDSPRPLKAKAAGPRYGAQAIWYGAGMAHRLSQGGNSNLATKQISWMIMDYRGLSWIIDYMGLWWMIMNNNGLS